MSDEIIILDGTYEVHPSATEGEWAVVNGETGRVRADNMTREDAIEYATDLNDDSDD